MSAALEYLAPSATCYSPNGVFMFSGSNAACRDSLDSNIALFTATQVSTFVLIIPYNNYETARGCVSRVIYNLSPPPHPESLRRDLLIIRMRGDAGRARRRAAHLHTPGITANEVFNLNKPQGARTHRSVRCSSAVSLFAPPLAQFDRVRRSIRNSRGV